MSTAMEPDLLEQVNRALGQMRAEYESDDELYGRFASPLYFKQLLGIAPSFLVGGRGTGKTTTLRSMSFGGQARITGSVEPDLWDVVGAYWKVEPSVVAVFKGKGVTEELWSSVFSHYLNLKLSTLVIEYAKWLDDQGRTVVLGDHAVRLFTRSLNIADCDSLDALAREVDLALVDIEAKINGNISALSHTSLSVLGRPLDYLFESIQGLMLSRQRPFMFCLDEYENLFPYQQKLLNTMIKQVGGLPYTFKIGVRNKVAIDRSTLVEEQPLQDPADFRTVDIVDYLKDESFDLFAATVVEQRLGSVHLGIGDPSSMLQSLSIEEEADLLGAASVRSELIEALEVMSAATSDDVKFAKGMSNFEACMAVRWAESHSETFLEVVRFARRNPGKWKVRLGNYGYAMLFTIRTKRVGVRKYYAGWKTYCQLADGNIRYLIRLMHEALRIHITDGNSFGSVVSTTHQTRAAARVGETTIRDLAGWSKQGAALTRFALGLGSIFGTLARETGLATPEVDQFRVSYSGSRVEAKAVDDLLGEAVGQGILIGFDGDKNARMSGATREMDYQLHPVLAPYFVYSSRRKRRMTLTADDIIALTVRAQVAPTIRRILGDRGAQSGELPHQLTVFSEA
ncbi:ORC-CDC6 family AAA ATPase [Mycobacteroides abscessus]|uniref:ORC-CDC6 family AAA ATPase n=1 Tax=Mycobacteroides abscessus TaxID=36809 RepID=UPI0009412EEE|nr:hypothetical protein [Mycobacteroides abscessus]